MADDAGSEASFYSHDEEEEEEDGDEATSPVKAGSPSAPAAVAGSASASGELSAAANEGQQYSLYSMLVMRSLILESETEVPEEFSNIKVVDVKLCTFPEEAPAPRQRKQAAPREKPATTVVEKDGKDGHDEEGKDGQNDMVTYANWPGKPGSWWRVHNQLGEDLIVREDVLITSKEIARIQPGELIQQSSYAKCLQKGPAKNVTRLPVVPSGWVTADATRAGGPKYLVRASIPRWRLVLEGKGGKPVKETTVAIRAHYKADHEVVMELSKGDVVEQAAPSLIGEDGVVRMAVTWNVARYGDTESLDDTHPRSSNGLPEAAGWVTVDATAVGGPIYFKPLAEADRDKHNNNNNGQRRRGRKPMT